MNHSFFPRSCGLKKIIKVYLFFLECTRVIRFILRQKIKNVNLLFSKNHVCSYPQWKCIQDLCSPSDRVKNFSYEKVKVIGRETLGEYSSSEHNFLSHRDMMTIMFLTIMVIMFLTIMVMKIGGMKPPQKISKMIHSEAVIPFLNLSFFHFSSFHSSFIEFVIIQ